ncbi:aminotransferase class V-fold PLP-dependent enzyme [Chloroflexi bacterium TSY]|nr:aminotransferase class V-fold PLP-dependent enzyme [Chloroflexi bacterium TSY]
MNIYEELGVRPIINAAGTVTRYGGSLMAAEVLDTMRAASQQFCVLDELHGKVGQRIANLLNVDAAYVTSSAASGLVLTAAACMAGSDPDKIAQLPDTNGMRHEILIQTGHRIAYDQAMRTAGAKLIEITDDGTPPIAAMQAAINDKTAAIFYLARVVDQPASIPFEQVVAMAHAAGIAVIVDAASECPPMTTLSRFSDAGVDLVIFSGGKSLMGPQSTGLIIGRQDLVAACAANGVPFAAIGRPMKVSREEIIAFLKALELYLARDHKADQRQWESQLAYVEQNLRDIPYITLTRLPQVQTYAVPCLSIRPEPQLGMTRDEIAEALLAGDPRIVVSQHQTADSVVINPHMLQSGQEEIVAQQCRAVLTGRAQQ